MSRLLWIFLLLFSQLLVTPTYGQSASDEGDIELCKWMSILSRDVMSKRQKNVPMSETLPWALGRLQNIATDMGLDVDEFTSEQQVAQQEFIQATKPFIAQIVAAAYERTAWDNPDLRRNEVNNFENAAFSDCYLASSAE